VNVSTGCDRQLVDSEHEITHYEPSLTTSDQELMRNSGQELTGSQQMMINSCHELTDSRPLPGSQHQQLQELAVSSDELQCIDRQAELAMDGAMLHHGYLDDLCPVCNDRVSGYHYGLQTCESCKGSGIDIKHLCSALIYTQWSL